MSRHILWKDIFQSISKSKGRFFSIAGLMALGSFALVGLKVAGPDMRAAGQAYAARLNTADMLVIGDDGLSVSDRRRLDGVSGVNKVEYGYLKDVTIKGKTTSMRLFSKPRAVSKYQLKSGRLPKAADEIALDGAYKGRYKLGSRITFNEKPDQTGKQVLRRHTYKVVGFVYSGEIISDITLGPTTAGSGELKGYGVIMPKAFKSDVYMTARLRFDNLIKLDPYGNTYKNRLINHKTAVKRALKDQPQRRLAEIKADAQKQLDQNQEKLSAAEQKLSGADQQLEKAQKQLAAGRSEIASKKQALNTQVEAAQVKIQAGQRQLAQAQSSLSTAKQQLAFAQAQLNAGRQQLNAKQAKLNQAQGKLAEAKTQLTKGQAAIQANQSELTAKRQQLTAGAGQYQAGISKLQTGIDQISAQLKQVGLTAAQTAALTQQRAELTAKLEQTKQAYAAFKKATYTPGMAKINAGSQQLEAAKQSLAAKQKQYAASAAQAQSGAAALKSGQEELASKQQLYAVNLAKYQTGSRELSENAQKLEAAKTQLASQNQAGEQQLAAAQKTLDAKQVEYTAKKHEFDQAHPGARKQILQGRRQLAAAKKQLGKLTLPVYNLYNRRELPGGDGYKTYTTVADIIDALANVFPIFLYFVAALVTYTTMGRFVDEERINAGTLRALGYDRRAVMAKFIFYGFTASVLGTVVGVIAGHTLLPMIVYGAYKVGFTLPPIALQFHPLVTLAAFVLALISAVLPAYLSARSELAEQPAELLLPKPPAAGSRIFLERLTPLWKHLSFTHKVTARNIFRYKKRMLMTIFGVAGAVSLLFTGFSVRASISNMGATQFGGIIHYDMIVAQNRDLSQTQKAKYAQQLASPAVKRAKAIHYESLSKAAGKNDDEQSITLVVPSTEKQFSRYIETRDRRSQRPLALTKHGALVSERFAKLVGARVGDTIRVKNAAGHPRRVKVSGITEMYMGHFMLMSKNAYQEAFGKHYQTNGDLVILKNGSQKNVEKQAAKFMALPATAGVVQNTTLTSQIATIVKSLNKIMFVLIIVAGMLAIVIMYNLTNINVSERIRELSTIKVLGFFDNEVTMYIYRETILLTGFGILAGYAIGDALFRYILAVVPPDEVMFNPSLAAVSFLLPLLLIVLITAALYWVVNQKLQHIDMLEALKSVD